jgi:histidinol-phosphate aminotransferase
MTNEQPSFLALATPGVRGLQPYQPGKPLSELEREYGIRDAVKLASNENPLGPSPKALAAARDALADMARYPDGNGFDLRQALARRHGMSAAAITLGNGSNDVLELVARGFLGPALAAVYSEHAFAVYPIVTQAIGAQHRVAQAREFGHDLEAMAALVDERVRVLFIANPNNPTGTWLPASQLEAFLQALPSRVIVVLDEAYFEYVDELDYPDTTSWIERFPNLVVTRTFSKAFGLAGLRVGYAVSDPQVADVLNRVRQPFNVNLAAQAAALAALDDRDYLERSVRTNREGMAQMTAGLQQLGIGYIPSVGNFLAVDLGRPAAPVYESLLREGVIVRPVANYGMPNHLRITIGAERENARCLAALAKVLG